MMAQYENIIRKAVEKLYSDERLRSNLTDGEAKVVLDWAAGWVTEQVGAARDETSAQQIAQDELARVRQTAAALNALAAKKNKPRLADAIAAAETGMQSSSTLTREQVLSLATAFASSLWRTLRTRAGKG